MHLLKSISTARLLPKLVSYSPIVVNSWILAHLSVREQEWVLTCWVIDAEAQEERVKSWREIAQRCWKEGMDIHQQRSENDSLRGGKKRSEGEVWVKKHHRKHPNSAPQSTLLWCVFNLITRYSIPVKFTVRPNKKKKNLVHSMPKIFMAVMNSGSYCGFGLIKLYKTWADQSAAQHLTICRTSG